MDFKIYAILEKLNATEMENNRVNQLHTTISQGKIMVLTRVA